MLYTSYHIVFLFFLYSSHGYLFPEWDACLFNVNGGDGSQHRMYMLATYQPHPPGLSLNMITHYIDISNLLLSHYTKELSKVHHDLVHMCTRTLSRSSPSMLSFLPLMVDSTYISEILDNGWIGHLIISSTSLDLRVHYVSSSFLVVYRSLVSSHCHFIVLWSPCATFVFLLSNSIPGFSITSILPYSTMLPHH